MGWFKDLTGVSSRDVASAAVGGQDYLINKGISDASGATDLFKTVRDPGVMSMNKGVMQGVNALSNIAFDDQGNLIRPQYQAPGSVSQGALDAMIARSQNDPMQALSQQYYGDVLGGGVNPYLSQMYDQAAGKVRSSLDSQFERAGRYGGAEHEMAMGGALGDLATNLYGGQYQSDMARRMQAAQLAPQSGYDALTRQYGYGQMQDAQAEEAANWDYSSGMQAVQDYLATLGAAKGGYTAQPNRNRGMEALSILSSIGQMAAAIPTGGASMAVPNPIMAGQGYGNYGGYA